ncbi:hypothetical protein AK830_g2115 [Neonectria ditissima]|uniref:Xaa-Pro dipeptidyl-peptidase C-terminal domain-containing protein n=1 Tax=Neonectria ditissima TaxID=78410 RepID=A0A0N8H8F8_9HYPO|nr:hypothetical protein AK830_g2115 [Neonectria ditissima]
MATRGFVGATIDRFIAWNLDLPPETCNYKRSHVTIALPNNGPTLAADLYQPIGHEPSGTVLVRGAYSRGIMIAMGSARIFASRGYQILFVSSRGTFGSMGVFDGGFSEAEDGQAVVEWMRQQDWYTGSFATLGMSYSSFTQWALLRDPPDDLVASVIIAGPHDFANYVWGTGAFNMHYISWTHTIVTQETASLAEQYKALNPGKHLCSIIDAIPLTQGVDSHFSGSRSAPWLTHAISHPDLNDPSWSRLQHGQALEKVAVPVLLINGWPDIFLEQTMEQYEKLAARGCQVKLIIGPWTHLQVQNSTTTRPILEWLEKHLSGRTDVQTGSAVQVYVMGKSPAQWLDLPRWPPTTTPLDFYLDKNGALRGQPPLTDTEPSCFRFDPRDPIPTLGGPLMVGGGFVDDTALAAREDILTFTTEPFPKPLTIMGKVSVELMHSSDSPSVDLFVRLSVVNKQRVSRNITQQYLRLWGNNGARLVRMNLSDTAYALNRGDCLRLIIGGGSHPMYSRNLGTEEPAEVAKAIHNATHTIHHGKEGVSRVTLPML